MLIHNFPLPESVAPGRPLFIQTKPYATEIIVNWAKPEGNVRVRGFRLGYGTRVPDENWVDDISPGVNMHTLKNLRTFIVSLPLPLPLSLPLPPSLAPAPSLPASVCLYSPLLILQNRRPTTWCR